jgi:hypothetical protein
MPPTPQCWQDALAAIDFSRAPLNPVRGTAFPEPHIILGLHNHDKKLHFVFMWMKLRPAVIHRAMTSTFAECIVSRQAWRDILYGKGFTSQDAMAKAEHIGQKPCRQRQINRCEEATKLLTDCHKSGLVTSPSLEGAAVWQDVQYPTPQSITDQVFSEVLLELATLNFRLELNALDHAMRNTTNSDIDSTVSKILLGSFGGDIFVVDVKNFSAPLASEDVRERGPYVIDLLSRSDGQSGGQRRRRRRRSKRR